MSGWISGTRAIGVTCTAIALAAALAGCGSDGKSTIIPGQPLPELRGKLTGLVQAPNGTYAKAPKDPQFSPFFAKSTITPSWWSTLLFGSAAYAHPLINVEPVGIGVLVSLSEVDEADAADGRIESPLPISQNSVTNADGYYSIINDAIDRIESCRLMVSVGNARNGDLSRAFVYAETTDLDPTSEAVVRVILDRLQKAPAVQLCDFSREGLKFITEEAIPAAAVASGVNVEEINDNAYDMVRQDCDVLDAINAVTQTTPDGPRQCRG